MQTLNQVPVKKRMELVIRSVYEDSNGGPGGTTVIPNSVRDEQIDTPPGGWTCLVDIESPDGKDTLVVTYDGNQYTDVVQVAGGEVAEAEEPAIALDAADWSDLLPKPQPL